MFPNTTQTTSFHIHSFVYVLCSFSTPEQKRKRNLSIFKIVFVVSKFNLNQFITLCFILFGLVTNKIEIHVFIYFYSTFTFIHTFSSVEFVSSIHFIFFFNVLHWSKNNTISLSNLYIFICHCVCLTNSILSNFLLCISVCSNKKRRHKKEKKHKNKKKINKNQISIWNLKFWYWKNVETIWVLQQ